MIEVVSGVGEHSAIGQDVDDLAVGFGVGAERLLL